MMLKIPSTCILSKLSLQMAIPMLCVLIFSFSSFLSFSEDRGNSASYELCLEMCRTWAMKTKEERLESCAELGKEMEKNGKYCTLLLIIMTMASPPQVEMSTCICCKKLQCRLPCICFFHVTGFCSFSLLDLPQCILKKKLL